MSRFLPCFSAVTYVQRMAQFPWFLSTNGFEQNFTTPNPEPLTVRAGDTLEWMRSFDEYPASQEWTLSYVLNSPTSRIVVVQADITASGDSFAILIPATETKAWAPGSYQWIAVAQNGTQRFTVALGRVAVEVDLLDAGAPQDTRTANELALANIDAMLAGRASDGVQQYTIHGRELRRYTVQELLSLRDFFRKRVDQERRDAGEIPPPSTIALWF